MPIRAPDPHNLRAMTNAAPAPIIETDRPCLGCGYNLRGLRAGILCPECGMPSVMPEGIDDPLAAMPRRVILAFVWGCWAASACVFGVVAAVIAKRIPTINALVPMTCLVGVSLLWIVATHLLTPAFEIPQAVIRGFSRAGKVRRTARRLQWGWVLASACAATSLALANRPSWLDTFLGVGSWVGVLVGLIGLVALCVLMERLADWARDESAQSMFNWAMWGIPLLTPVLILQGPIFPLGWMWHLLAPLLWLIVVGMFPYGLLMLSKSVSLSIVHSFEHEERGKRREERRQNYHDHVGKLVEKMDKRR